MDIKAGTYTSSPSLHLPSQQPSPTTTHNITLALFLFPNRNAPKFLRYSLKYTRVLLRFLWHRADAYVHVSFPVAVTTISRFCPVSYWRTQHLHFGFFFKVTCSTCDASPGPWAVTLPTSTVAAFVAGPTFSLTGCC